MLREQDADVVALEEANDRAVCERLATSLGYELVYGEANSEFAVAWLSRLPVDRVENHRLPVFAKTLLEMEIGGVQLLATHLVHGDAAEQRAAEVEAILDRVRPPAVLVGDFNAVRPDDEVGEPPRGENLRLLDRRSIELILTSGMRDCYRSLHDAHGWTYKAWHPFLRIDFVFAQGLESRSCDVVEADASDHFAVVADF